MKTGETYRYVKSPYSVVIGEILDDRYCRASNVMNANGDPALVARCQLQKIKGEQYEEHSQDD